MAKDDNRMPLEVNPPAAFFGNPVAANARIWGPQWTLGLQPEAVSRQQAQGRRVFTWTIDIQKNAEQYIREGSFDGILSNYPSIIAYTYYARD